MSFSFITEAKKVTHFIAGAGAMALTWALSEQGQEVIGGIIKAYPKAAIITSVLGFLMVLYHSPKALPK